MVCDSAHTVLAMGVSVFEKTTELPASARDVFAWHQSPSALQTLIPPWERVEIEQAPASLADGEIAILVMRIGPFKQRWVAKHVKFIDRGDDGGEFTDIQVSGPFAEWTHQHVIRAIEPKRCTLTDRIEYKLPFGALGDLFAGWLVKRKLNRMFDYRHDATKAALLAMQK